MKITSIFSTTILALSALSFTAQSDLLEHIPTNEFAVVKFNGAALLSKSKELNQLAISDSISNQFNRLLKEYKQYLIDDNTSVSESEINEIKTQIEQSIEPPTDQLIEEEIYDDEVYEKIQDDTEVTETVVDAYDYNNQNYDNYYKVKPKLTLEKIFMALMSKGTDYGVSNTTNYYFIVGINDSIQHTALLFNKSDATKFDQFITSVIPNKQRDKLINLKSGYEYFVDENVMFAWNKDVVAFIDYSIPYRYNYNYYGNNSSSEDEEYYETYEERLAAKAKKKEEAKKLKLESVLNQIFKGKPEHSLKLNTNYAKTLSEQGDVTYFMNAFGGQTDMYFRAFGGRSSKRNNEFMGLFKDNFGYGSLNFNNNDIIVNNLQHVGAKYLKQIKEINKNKFNKSMYKYIDGENLLGIAGFSTNLQPAYEMYKDMYISILGNIREDEQWLGTAADIGFTFFDEKELFDLVQGDFIFAITDIKEFDMEYTSYDYDDDYNRIETIKTKKETLPEFVSIATIGNKELRDKIVKLMNQAGVVTKKDHYFELQEPKSRYSERAAKPLNVFYMIKGDILIITNDEELVKSNNGNGLAKAKQINGEAYKLMKKNNIFAYWTPESTYNKIPREFSDELKPLKSIAETYKSLEFSGVNNKGNIFNSTAKINLTDNSKGSLMLSLDLINDVMKAAAGGY